MNLDLFTKNDDYNTNDCEPFDDYLDNALKNVPKTVEELEAQIENENFEAMLKADELILKRDIKYAELEREYYKYFGSETDE